MLKYKLIGYQYYLPCKSKQIEKVYIDDINVENIKLWDKFVKEKNISMNCPKKIIPLINEYKYSDFLEDINKECTIVLIEKKKNRKKYFYTITQYKNFISLIIMGTDAYYEEKEYLSVDDFLSDKIINGETILDSWNKLILNRI